MHFEKYDTTHIEIYRAVIFLRTYFDDFVEASLIDGGALTKRGAVAATPQEFGEVEHDRKDVQDTRRHQDCSRRVFSRLRSSARFHCGRDRSQEGPGIFVNLRVPWPVYEMEPWFSRSAACS